LRDVAARGLEAFFRHVDGDSVEAVQDEIGHEAGADIADADDADGFEIHAAGDGG